MPPVVLSPSLQHFTKEWQTAIQTRTPAAVAVSPADFLTSVRTAGCLYGKDPVCVVRQPMVVDDKLIAAYQDVLPAFHTAIRVARALLIEDGLDGRPDSLAVRIGVDQQSLALASIDPGYTSTAVLARADSYLVQGPGGGLHPLFLELNAESPAGMAYNDALSALTLADPLTHALAPPLVAFGVMRTVARAVLATWRAWDRSPRAPTVAPTVAIVDLAGVPTAPEFKLFARAFEAQGVRCLVPSAGDLEFDGHHLSADGQAIDLVYRRLLVSDVHRHPAETAALVAAYRAGAICVVNSFRTSLLHGKGLFALLHDPVLRRRLPAGVSLVLDRCIPWTGLLTPDAKGSTEPLRERALRTPEGWVLKPLSGHGGQGVVLGWRADAKTWRRAVCEAQAHVLQRRVLPWRAVFPDARRDYALQERVVSLDPFLVRGSLAGFLCRLSETELANVTAGAATQTPVLSLV